ncbi:MAG TPA: class I SAM-dependent methyltransferase [Desulfobacterales bacterium]|nr:class I SAM-dependent methyltransferase [Desulfobacterales bacterium]
MRIPPEVRCPDHMEPLFPDAGGEAHHEDPHSLCCPCGCRFPVFNGIARFVGSRHYATAFGKQWKAFRKTQLDSFTGTTISRDRLKRCLGGSLGVVRNKSVLEAGCGAGRFTEVLLSEGARVFACDLSEAVEANWENCQKYSNYFICQADILRLPVCPEQFDVVICIGVVQHTANPEKTMAALCSQVKPGGILVMDHYTQGYAVTPSRRLLRSFLLHTPSKFPLRFCEGLAAFLWPVHQSLSKIKDHRTFGRLYNAFVSVSPLVDYHNAYSQLGANLLRTWAILDTHDTLTDVYKHLRSAEEIAGCLRNCGMDDIETAYAGNGVEARARKPTRQTEPTAEATKGAV